MHLRQVRMEYMVPDTEDDFVFADGGKCYSRRRIEVRLKNALRCPMCPWKRRTFDTWDAYNDHCWSSHMSQ